MIYLVSATCAISRPELNANCFECHLFVLKMPEEEVSEEEEGEDSEEEEEAEIESDHESLCHVCEEDGELICCDQCPKVYHLDCHEPAIRRLPRWVSLKKNCFHSFLRVQLTLLELTHV